MAEHFAFEAGGYANTQPAKMANGAYHGGRLRRYRAKITLAAQAIGDTIVLADIPKGYHFSHGKLTSSVSLGTSTLAIGTAVASGKYRAAAAFTAVETPTDFGAGAAGLAATVMGGEPIDPGERVIATVGVAALPASGTLLVDLYYTGP